MANAGRDIVTLKIPLAGKLRRLLNSVPAKDGKRAFRKASRAGAKVIQGAMKRGAPVKSGRTRKAIKVRATKPRKWYIGAAATIGKGDYKGETYYAAFNEFGYRRGRRPGRGSEDNRKQVPATHDLQRAAEGASNKAQHVFTREAIKELRQVRG